MVLGLGIALRIGLISVSTSLCWASAYAQQIKVARIGFLSASVPASLATRVDAFRQGLKELGYVEGRNFVMEYGWAAGKLERLPALAAELQHKKVDVIVTAGPSATRAAKEATTRPIVMAFDSDPVGSGFVASLARPGGNITGLSNLGTEVSGKQLELLKQIVPNLSRVAVVGDSKEPANDRSVEETRRVAGALALQVHYHDIQTAKSLEDIFRAARSENADAVLVLTSSVTPSGGQFASLAAANRLPVMYWHPRFVEHGGLMSYSVHLDDLFRRAASYVDKILKGAKPADLPVELPYKFDLVINLKAAKQIGLAIPVDVLTRADRVIQ